MSTVVQFPKGKALYSPISQFLRVGEHHRVFGDLWAAGNLGIRRVVFEAGRLKRQGGLLKTLKSEGVEITIDTGAAEVSSKARFSTFVGKSPWLEERPNAPLGPKSYNLETIDRIAQMAVDFGIDRVLAPSHYLGDRNYEDWLNIDFRSVEYLRNALDKLGGGSICIDYPLIDSVQSLQDTLHRNMIVEGLSNLPVDTVWFRLSGLGKEPGPQKIRSMIKMLGKFHNLGRPLILDYCSELNFLAAEAFGVASGASCGLLELDQFNAGQWHQEPKPRDPNGGFRRKQMVPLLGFGQGMSVNDFNALASARGGRRVLLQSDFIEAKSIEDLIQNKKMYSARHLNGSINDLEMVPDLNRVEHLLSKTFNSCQRRAKEINKLKIDEKLSNFGDDLVDRLNKRKKKLFENTEKVTSALEKLSEELGRDAPRVRSCELNLVDSTRIGGQG
ncbi:MAG: hypothetical protein ACPGOY_01200 [Rhodospirillaceae bacterium]